MTETVLREIVRRAVSDAAFRGQLRSDPAKALAGISLTGQERTALTSGDPTQLTALGIDQRMSKAFSAGVFAEASKVVSGGTDVGANAQLTDEPTAGQRSGIAGDPAVSAAAAFESPYSSAATHQMRIAEGNIDTGSAALAEPSHSAQDYQLTMTEGTIPSDVAASYTSATDQLLRTAEGNIPSDFEASYTSTTDQLLRTAEGNIPDDTGAVVDPGIVAPADVQINPGDASPSDF
jgi:hypothetical protein